MKIRHQFSAKLFNPRTADDDMKIVTAMLWKFLSASSPNTTSIRSTVTQQSPRMLNPVYLTSVKAHQAVETRKAFDYFEALRVISV